MVEVVLAEVVVMAEWEVAVEVMINFILCTS